jgi:hypothetical protein
MRPVRYSGRSGSIAQAKANISAGPMSQLRTSDITSDRRSVTTVPIERYFTLARTGYIMRRRPSAIGNDTESIFTVSSQSSRSSNTLPRTRPSTMARPIQSGRNRSSVERRGEGTPASFSCSTLFGC